MQLVVDASVAIAASHRPIAPISIRTPAKFFRSAWDLADEMGWAKTYDAQYVALARMLGCKVVTLDERLIRSIERLNVAIRPRDL